MKNPVFGRGILAGIVVIVAIAVFFGLFLLGSSGSGTSVPAEPCGQKVTAYVNTNLVAQGTSAELVRVRETSGMYEVMIRYRGSEIPLYATRDCMLLFMDSYRMPSSETCDTQAGTCSTSTVQATPTPSAPVKSARPAVELYVMSFCPYGIQVENAMKPVVDLLGDSADIRVRYIATVTGEDLTAVRSLHGNAEAVEDVRQLCIAKYSQAGFWRYLMAFNARCYPAWNDPAKLSACQKNVTAESVIDMTAVDRCVAGSEGLALLKTDETSSIADRATSSPTLLINGQRYTGARTPEAIKQAICSHYNTPPAACDTVLASQGATVSGTC